MRDKRKWICWGRGEDLFWGGKMGVTAKRWMFQGESKAFEDKMENEKKCLLERCHEISEEIDEE